MTVIPKRKNTLYVSDPAFLPKVQVFWKFSFYVHVLSTSSMTDNSNATKTVVFNMLSLTALSISEIF